MKHICPHYSSNVSTWISTGFINVLNLFANITKVHLIKSKLTTFGVINC